MVRDPLVLDELDREGAVLSCTPDEARALAGSGLVEMRPEGGLRWRCLPRGYVGAVRVGDIQVQVNPKERVRVRHLLFLLGYAADPRYRPDDVSAVADDELWPAMAESVARSVERALAQGVVQGYRTVEESLRTVRGRIRIGDQIGRHQGMMLPLEATYDEFTVDTPENQILRAALRRIVDLPGVSGSIRQRLRHLNARLEGVTPLLPGSDLPKWHASRMNERYRPALRLCEVVLRNTSTSPGPGGPQMASFVVSMWSVFENFVTAALSEALSSRPGRTRGQYPAELDLPQPGERAGAIKMAIDVVHCDTWGRPLVVYDAKYKTASPAGIYANADHYQMLAYCTALQVPTAWLIYAQGGGRPVARRIRNSGVTVVEYPLDLALKPERLLEQIGHLADVSTSPERRGQQPA